MKFKPLQMLNRWDTKRIFIKTFYQFTFKPDSIEE